MSDTETTEKLNRLLQESNARRFRLCSVETGTRDVFSSISELQFYHLGTVKLSVSVSLKMIQVPHGSEVKVLSTYTLEHQNIYVSSFSVSDLEV